MQVKLATPWAQALLTAAYELRRHGLIESAELYGPDDSPRFGVKLGIWPDTHEFSLMARPGGGIMVIAHIPPAHRSPLACFKSSRRKYTEGLWHVARIMGGLTITRNGRAVLDYQGLTDQAALNAMALDALRSS